MGKDNNVSLVGDFLYQQYGIKLRSIGSKLRATLLDEVEHVACNLCGHNDGEPVASQDKYGLPLTTVMCRYCGLLYLDPRPTAESYRRFYEQGGERDSIYHRRIDFDAVEDLLKIYYGPDFAMDAAARSALQKFMETCRDTETDAPGKAKSIKKAKIESDKKKGAGDKSSQAKTQVHGFNEEALQIYEMVKGYIPRGSKIFEAGASRGKKLLPWRDLHGCEVSGVEPKKKTVMEAKERNDLDLIQGFADDPRIPENAYDLVINTRTINHMLNPLGDLHHAWRWLKPGGILFVDIEDAIAEACDRQFDKAVIQFDHAYMFSERTLIAMIQKAGFKILQHGVVNFLLRGSHEHQIRIVAQKSASPVTVDWPSYTRERAALKWARARCAANDRRQNIRLIGKALSKKTRNLIKTGRSRVREIRRSLRRSGKKESLS